MRPSNVLCATPIASCSNMARYSSAPEPILKRASTVRGSHSLPVSNLLLNLLRSCRHPSREATLSASADETGSYNSKPIASSPTSLRVVKLNGVRAPSALEHEGPRLHGSQYERQL